MSVSQQDLEHIVKEVLRRLREREMTNKVLAESVSEVTTANTLRLAEKVIALRTLPDKLAGIKRIIVPRGAVVTPLVRDELRTRNIQLEFAGVVTARRVSNRLLLAATASHNLAGLVKRLSATGIEIEEVMAANWREAITKMTNQLKDNDACGLLLTNQAALAACTANRNPAVRAAVAADARSAKDAMQSLGANLLVVDPAAHSLYALENIIREYANGTPSNLSA